MTTVSRLLERASVLANYFGSGRLGTKRPSQCDHPFEGTSYSIRNAGG